MIKDLIIENIKIESGKTETLFVKRNISGKILKIAYRISPEAISKPKLQIFTREGEEILGVDETGVYYPRANISSQKMQTNAVGYLGDKFDYFYFTKGLLFKVVKNSPVDEDVIIDKIIVVYEDGSR